MDGQMVRVTQMKSSEDEDSDGSDGWSDGQEMIVQMKAQKMRIQMIEMKTLMAQLEGWFMDSLVHGMIQFCVVWFMTSVVMRFVISILLLTESPQQIRGMLGWGIGCQGIFVVALIALCWSTGGAMTRYEPPAS